MINKKSKNIIVKIGAGILLALFVFLFSSPVLAAVQQVNLSPEDVPKVIYKVANWLYGIGWGLVIVMGIWTAFLYISGGMKADNVKKAHKSLLFLVIGAIILTMAVAVDKIVISILEK